MWGVVVLLFSSVLSVECYAVPDLHERLAHGRQLKIYLPKSAEKLMFIPAEEPGVTFQYWSKGGMRLTKGRVSGTGNDRRWYIDQVTYEDEGTYIQKDFWDKEISTVKVAVTPRHVYVKRIPGEALLISLEGIDIADATLWFSGETANVTLVRNGSPVGRDLPEYWDRLRTHQTSINLRDVNTSDVGRYVLWNRRNRKVSVTRMELTDHHEQTAGNPLLALLLLLGIPVGICCCCRKKIFRQKASTSATLQATPETVAPPPGGPGRPPPAYYTPGGPPGGPPGTMYYHGPEGNMDPTVHPPPGQWNGPPPAPGFNPTYPPQNPTYPPQNPTYTPQNPVYPPAQPPQWNAPMPDQYPPAPGASMGYNPVMYTAPQTEEVKIEQMASSPTDPLLAPAQAHGAPPPDPSGPPVPPSTAGVLSSSDSAHHFQIDSGKNSSSNFL